MNRRVVAELAALGLTLASAFTLAPLVVTGLWLPRALLCLAAPVLVLLLARSRTASAALPTLLALVAGVLSIGVVFFREESLAGVIPTQGTIQAAIDLVTATLVEMRTSYPPISSGDGVPMLVAAGVLVVFLLVELLAVGAWAPAWAGLPVLGLWCVPIMLGSSVSLVTIVIASACYAVLIAIQARDDARFRRWPDVRATRSIAAVTVGALVVSVLAAPLLLRIPAPIRWHPFYELVGSSTTRLDLGIGLRDDLTRNDDTPLLEYSGATAAQVGPLHAYTVEEFTGNEWIRGPQAQTVANDGQLLFPTPVDDLDTDPRQFVSMTIFDLGQDRLLLPGEPREVSLAEDSGYVADADEVVVHIGSEVSYGLTITPRVLDADTLQGLRPATDVDPELLEVPQTGYESDIAALARQIVEDADAQTPYEQLLALQNYLRDPARFVYSTTIASPRTPDAVWDFLNDRHGYCVQFATTMIVMARSLGMPARLAVGFLPGETNADGVTTVAADQAHAWPQVLFDGVGWVRFEPTPGVQAGPPPVYAPEPDPTASASSTTPSASPSATTASSTGGATSSTSASAGGADRDTGRSVLAWVAVLVGLAAIAATAALLAARRARARPRDLDDRWRHVLLHLERLEIDVGATQTPRAVVRAAASVLDPEAWQALSRLAAAVETFRYDRAGAPRPSDDEIEAWVAVVIEATRERLRRSREPAGV